jgi:SH3-like domain-containing protein
MNRPPISRPIRRPLSGSRCASLVAPATFRRAFLLAAAALLAAASPSAAQQTQRGPVTGLPIPRFVSLKSDRVNLREGPSKEHPTLWVFERAGLPVEITAEFEIWRKIRDSEGTEGWVLHSLLSGRRTALVAPWKKEPSMAFAKDRATPVARLAPGVVANLRLCDGNWCRVSGEGFDGYVKQENLWGVYPGERIE